MRRVFHLMACVLSAQVCMAVDRVDILRATIEAVAPGARFSGDPKAYSFLGTLSGTTDTESGGWTIHRSDGIDFRIREAGSGYQVTDKEGHLLYTVKSDGNDIVFSPALSTAPPIRARKSGQSPASGYTGWTCDGRLRTAMASTRAPEASAPYPSSREIGLGEYFDRKYESQKSRRAR